jgi:hypothetical protein
MCRSRSWSRRPPRTAASASRRPSITSPNNGVFENTNGGDVFYTNRTFDLSGISGVNDNPSFGVRMVTVFDPATGTSYTPSNPGSSYGTTGTVRYDNVTVTSAHRWIGGTGTDIATAANYAGGASAPTAASTLLFAGTSNLTVTAAAAQSAAQVVFGAGAGNYTLSGSPLTLSAGVVNNSTGTQTIGNALDLSSFPQTIYANAAGGNLVLSGNVTISNQALLSTNLNGNLNVDGPGDVTVNGALSSATGANLDLGIRKSGTGTLFLNNAGNTLAAYAGGNLVAGGRLAGTGTAPGNWSMASGTTVQGGNGTAVGGTLTVGGNLTLTNTSTIRTVAGNGGTPTDTTTAGASLVDVDGNLNRSGAADTIRIELVNDGTLVTDGSTLYTRRVLTYTGLGTNLTEGTFTAGGPFEVTGLPVAAGWQVIVGSGNVDVRFTPVPEPGAVLGLAAAGLGLAGLVRRARRTSPA